MLGLIRQETEFDPSAVSGAGARGIMQIMPATARHTASVAGLPYRPNDLLADPNYNMQLGMAEFGGDLNDWNGSLIIAAAAYNAGPNNVKKWLASYGDPRSPATDPLDWIEKIPFSETRNYVMRVLENTQIYRNRLAGRDQPLRIMERSLPAERAGREGAGLCAASVRRGRSRAVAKAGRDELKTQWNVESHSRARRCACAIWPAFISAEICARQRFASSTPRIAARLNHLCAATKSTPTPWPVE